VGDTGSDDVSATDRDVGLNATRSRAYAGGPAAVDRSVSDRRRRTQYKVKVKVKVKNELTKRHKTKQNRWLRYS